jgi:2-keto-3-deoxy-L-rhamnonate aldolase RhmA
VFIDCEQGSPDVESVENMARAARLHRTASLVRVFDPKDWVLERYLLRGVDGVVAPRLDRAADARRVVEGVRYCFPDAPESKFVVVQIESAAAVAELDEFFAVEGIDVYFIGPVDLAKSMGRRGDFRHPEVQEVMDDIIDRALAADCHVGILADAENAADYVAKGVRFLYIHANDFIDAGAQAFVRRMNSALG